MPIWAEGDALTPGNMNNQQLSTLIVDSATTVGGSLTVSGNLTASASLSMTSQVRVRANRSTEQVIPDATLTNINFDVEDFDTGGLHDTVTNNDRITVPTGEAGLYLVTASIEWALNATGRRQLAINHSVDGLIARSKTVPTADFDTAQNATALYEMLAGEFFTVEVFQNSGGNLDANPTGLADAACTFSAVKLF